MIIDLQELGGDLEDGLEPAPHQNGSAPLDGRMDGLSLHPAPPLASAPSPRHAPLAVQTAPQQQVLLLHT